MSFPLKRITDSPTFLECDLVHLVVLQYIVSDIPYDIANMSESALRITKPLRLIKASNVLEPMDIDTIDGRAVSQVDLVPRAIEVDVPDWLSDAAHAIDHRLRSFENLYSKLNERQEDIEKVFPELVQAYKELLASQHSLYLQAESDKDTLVHAQRTDFEAVRLASENFARSVQFAMQASEEKQTERFQALAGQAEMQAQFANEYALFFKGVTDEHHGAILSLAETSKTTEGRLKTLERQSKVERKKAKEDMRQLAEKTRKQVAAFLEIALEKVQSQNPEVAEASLRELAQSLKDGKSLEELSLRERSDKKGKAKAPLEEQFSVPPPPVDDEDEEEGVQWETVPIGARYSDPNQGPAPPTVAQTPIRVVQATAPTPVTKVSGKDSKRSSKAGSVGGGNPPPPRNTTKIAPRSHSSSSSSSSDDSDPDDHGFSSDSDVDRKKKKSSRMVVTTVEQPKIPPPERFTGKHGKLQYRDWVDSLDRWFDYYRGAYKSDKQKLIYIGQAMGGDALTWFNARARFLKKQKLEDNWKAFMSAMDAEFINEHEDDDMLEEMKALRYDKNIDAYLQAMQTRNYLVGLSGVAWRNLLLGGLSEELRKRMSYSDLSEDDDTAFIFKIKRVGREYEKHLAKEAALRKHAQEIRGSGPKNSSQKGSKGGNSDPLKPQGSDHKVGKRGDKGQGKGKTVGKADKPFTNDKLKGIAPTLIEKRKKENLCLHCGQSGHRWSSCTGDKVTTAARKLAGQKRRIPDAAIEAEQNGNSGTNKRPKVSARSIVDRLCDRDARPAVSSSSLPPRRITLLESDSEKED